jgi:hypothetical protein
MQCSADISPDDQRDYIDFLDLASEEEVHAEDRADWSAREGVLTLLAVVAFVGFIGHLLYSKGLDHWIQHPIYLAVLVTGLLFACLCFGVTWEQREMRWRWDGDRLDHTALREGFNLGQARFDLRPEGLGVTFDVVRNCYAWQGFQSFGEGPNAFYLMFTKGDDIIVPKRAFMDEAARESFKEFAVSRIGDRK